MLDLPTIRKIRLTPRPLVQRFIAGVGLIPNYALRGITVRLEGVDNVPDEPVYFAMNHTDRYNYWPFQLRWWRQADRFTATWVKGKYYRNPGISWFMRATNNIPTVSRGYLISQDFVATVGRKPSADEYNGLRAWVDGRDPEPPGGLPGGYLTTERDILGRAFDPSTESYSECIQAIFSEMMLRFVELNREAIEKRLDLLVFPQGTRSKRLQRGRIGLAQMALKLDIPVVPVGCNGSDRLYPTGSPWARPGHVVLRIGAPLTRDDLAEYRPSDDYAPFSPAAESAHRDTFQAFSDVVMDRINELLDPEYQYGEDQPGGVTGVNRFI